MAIHCISHMPKIMNIFFYGCHLSICQMLLEMKMSDLKLIIIINSERVRISLSLTTPYTIPLLTGNLTPYFFAFYASFVTGWTSGKSSDMVASRRERASTHTHTTSGHIELMVEHAKLMKLHRLCKCAHFVHLTQHWSHIFNSHEYTLL